MANHLLIDSHEDLAWNMLTFGRDYTRAAAETRLAEREAGSQAPLHNGDTLLGWPDYRRGRVAVVFATLFAAPARRSLGAWDTQAYATFDEAHARYQAQLDAYHRLCAGHPGKFRLVGTRADLAGVLKGWEEMPGWATPAGQGFERDRAEGGAAEIPQEGCPVGVVVLMEGAEGVREPGELEMWWARGVRLIGPAWAGTRFCGGTREPGPLTKDGFALLEAMAEIGFTLDLSHMDERAALQALDSYPGAVVATHANAAALLEGADTNRHLTTPVLQGLLAREGVIGVVAFNKFLEVGWTVSRGREAVGLRHLVAQIDFICQTAGNARQVGLGTDFDGGFGWQSVPHEIDTIADLQRIAPLLAARGYSEADIAAILGANWRALLERTLPETG